MGLRSRRASFAPSLHQSAHEREADAKPLGDLRLEAFAPIDSRVIRSRRSSE
jgi:hypothetical protein